MLVGDASSNSSLSIIAYEGAAIGAEDPEFMLYDRERDLAYWVRVVPTPTTAAVLLESHGDRPEVELGRAARGAAGRVVEGLAPESCARQRTLQQVGFKLSQPQDDRPGT